MSSALLDRKLVRLQLENDEVIGEEWLLQDRKQCVRDVKQEARCYVLDAERDNAASSLQLMSQA